MKFLIPNKKAIQELVDREFDFLMDVPLSHNFKEQTRRGVIEHKEIVFKVALDEDFEKKLSGFVAEIRQIY